MGNHSIRNRVLTLAGAVLLVTGIWAGAWAGPAAAAEGPDSKFSRESIKKAFTREKEVELRPVEEMFEDAESYFNGRPTWYGKPRRNYPKARDLYRGVVDNYPFSSYGPAAELGVANCHFEMEEYEEAAVWYELYVKKHARLEPTPFAMFRLGMCQFEMMLKPGRDQDHTRQAVAHFELLIERFPDSSYAADAREKLLACNQNLARHELGVAEYYFKRKEYWSAAARYQGVWRGYPGLGLDEQAMFMEGQCYEKLGKADLARSLYEQAGAQSGADENGRKAAGEYGRKAADRLQGLDKKSAP